MDDPRYPVGKYTPPQEIGAEQRREWIGQIAEAPARLREAVRGLNDEQLDTPYRDGGWTVRQVVHHVPDSHMNAFIRFKLALTEDTPTIKTYEEAEWAKLPDVRETPVETSLTLLDTLHDRFVRLLSALTDEQWGRAFRHPEWGEIRLEQTLGLYAWHGRHHVAHITGLRERQGW
ncbi:MAG TPA: bacillithiol transferase BstA [Longimicrobiaceae bacterium]|nr:bacillithiol transferase BstA [Longimicrobiaceae bacterium]